MGNFSSISFRPSSASGRVILRDGSVHEFKQPLTVAELMLEHPQQVVVEFHSAVTGKRPTPLHADKKLDMKMIYLMVPKSRGKPVEALAAEEIRQVILIANSAIHSRSFLFSSRLFPWFAKICPVGVSGPTVRNVGEGLGVKKKGDVDRREDLMAVIDFLQESLELRPEYLSKQFSGKGWKPSLDTIEERKIEQKVSHWLF